jgi:hypothetical protein
MPKNTTNGRLRPSFLASTEEERLRALFAYLEARVPAAYRSEVLSYLLPRALPTPSDRPQDAPPPLPASSAVNQGRSRAAARSGNPEMEPYAELLSRRGETLLKALVALHLAGTVLGIRWMTPTELARLLGEIDDKHRVYRSNLSNALRKEQDLVSRRRRGRGYEYELTARGHARVARELRLLGFAADGEPP